MVYDHLSKTLWPVSLARLDSNSDMFFDSEWLLSFTSDSSFFFTDSMLARSDLVFSSSCSFDSSDLMSNTARSFCSADTLLEYDSFSEMNSSSLDIVSCTCSSDLSVSLTEMEPATRDFSTASSIWIMPALVCGDITSYGFAIISSIIFLTGFSNDEM